MLTRTLSNTNAPAALVNTHDVFTFPMRAETPEARDTLKAIATLIEDGDNGQYASVCQIDPVIDSRGNLSVRLVGKLYTREGFDLINAALREANKLMEKEG